MSTSSPGSADRETQAGSRDAGSRTIISHLTDGRGNPDHVDDQA